MRNKLSFIWDTVNSSNIEAMMNEIADKNYYTGIADFPTTVLFEGLSDDQSIKAQEFLLNYITKYAQDSKKMNAVFDTVRRKLPVFMEAALHHYVSVNPSVDNFKNIDWVGNPGVMMGEVNWGDLMAERWEKVAAILQNHPNRLITIPLKAYVKEAIGHERERAEYERKRSFKYPEW